MVGVETHVWLTQPRDRRAPVAAERRRRRAARERAHRQRSPRATPSWRPSRASRRARDPGRPRLGLDSDELWRVGYAARLHDIGKLAIPARVSSTSRAPERLRVAGRSSATPIVGAQILEEIPVACAGRAARPGQPRALGRRRLSRRHRRRGHPDRVPNRLRMRRLRRDDLGTALPGRSAPARGARRARAAARAPSSTRWWSTRSRRSPVDRRVPARPSPQAVAAAASGRGSSPIASATSS